MSVHVYSVAFAFLAGGVIGFLYGCAYGTDKRVVRMCKHDNVAGKCEFCRKEKQQ